MTWYVETVGPSTSLGGETIKISAYDESGGPRFEDTIHITAVDRQFAPVDADATYPS